MKPTTRLFTLAFVLLLIGYFGIKLFYDEILELPGATGHTFTSGLVIMAIFNFFTGAGGNAVGLAILYVFTTSLNNCGCQGLVAALNATINSFPDKMVSLWSVNACSHPTKLDAVQRASVTGLVVSGYGLSAFAFSTLAHTVFPGDTSNFLLILALGTSLPMAIGSLIVRVVPHDDASGSYVAIDTEEPEGSTIHGSLFHDRPSRTSPSDLVGSRRSRSASSSFDLPIPEFGSSVPLQGTAIIHQYVNLGGITETSEIPDVETLRDAQLSTSQEINAPDIHGKALFMSSDFWLLFAIVSLRKSCPHHHLHGFLTLAIFSCWNWGNV